MRGRSRSGYSLVELVLVMMLLVLVASLVFSLTAAGSRAWMRITEAGERRSELRTAMSYIDVQLKKSDSIDSISVRAAPNGSGTALRLVREIKNPTIPDFDQSETWIYVQDGQLYELHTLPGMPLQDAMITGQPLVAVDGWDIRVVSDELIEITLISRQQIDGSEVSERLTRQYYVRSGGLDS